MRVRKFELQRLSVPQDLNQGFSKVQYQALVHAPDGMDGSIHLLLVFRLYKGSLCS